MLSLFLACGAIGRITHSTRPRRQTNARKTRLIYKLNNINKWFIWLLEYGGGKKHLRWFLFPSFFSFFNNLSLWCGSARPIRDNAERSLKWIGKWMLSWFGSRHWARVLLKPPLIEISREGALWGAFVCESFLGDWCKIFTASAAFYWEHGFLPQWKQTPKQNFSGGERWSPGFWR